MAGESASNATAVVAIVLLVLIGMVFFVRYVGVGPAKSGPSINVELPKP